jgi:hypothetical protein
MQFNIHSKLIGSDYHFEFNEDYVRWVETPSPNSWIFSGEIKQNEPPCLDTLIRLNHLSLDHLPPARFVSAMNTVMSGSADAIPWQHILPRDVYKSFIENLLFKIKEIYPQLNREFYETTWVPQARIFQSLHPLKIDEQRYHTILSESGLNRRIIESFKPNEDGAASPIVYDRFGTRTGRLTVKSGPSVLTLKKEYRNMITSSFAGGSIMSIDFTALEARVLLYEAGGECPDADLYSYISQNVFAGQTTRKMVKGAVISELYGSSKAALGQALNISGEELNDFVFKVKNLFRTNDLKKRLKSEFLNTGFITNRYGKKIAIDEPLDHIFVNSYAQSTGVDVSLLGFSNFVKTIEGNNKILPLFLLHDGLILDVHPDEVEGLSSLKSIKIPGYLNDFFVKVEKFA